MAKGTQLPRCSASGRSEIKSSPPRVFLSRRTLQKGDPVNWDAGKPETAVDQLCRRGRQRISLPLCILASIHVSSILVFRSFSPFLCYNLARDRSSSSIPLHSVYYVSLSVLEKERRRVGKVAEVGWSYRWKFP